MWRTVIFISVVGFVAAELPAQASDPTTNSAGTILVFPFEVPPGATAQWIGRGAQEDLITDLTQATHAQIKSPAEPFPARDAAAALKHARELKATIVIFGQAQVVDLAVRLTGQVLDVASEKPIGAIKVTGPLSELFQLEDALAREVFSALPQNLLKPEVLQYLQDTAAVMQQPTQDATDSNQIATAPLIVSSGPGPYVYEPQNPPYAPVIQPSAPSYSPSAGWNDLYGYNGIGPYDAGLYAGWWIPPGTVVVISNLPSRGHHRDSHRDGGHGRWDGDAQPAPHSTPDNPNGNTNPVPVQFTWGGVAGQTGAVGRAPVQAAPRGFSGNGSSRPGFSTMSGPRLGSGFHSISGFGAGLGNTGHGGTVGR